MVRDCNPNTSSERGRDATAYESKYVTVLVSGWKLIVVATTNTAGHALLLWRARRQRRS